MASSMAAAICRWPGRASPPSGSSATTASSAETTSTTTILARFTVTDRKWDYGAAASTTTPERVASNGTSPGMRGASTSSVTVPFSRSYSTTLRDEA